MHEYSNVGNNNGRLSPQTAHERLDCRLCGGDVEVKLKLKDTPIANAFQDCPGEVEKYPLELAQCVDCDHVQLKHVIPDEIIFPRSGGSKKAVKPYFYSTPDTNKSYLHDLAKRLYGMVSNTNFVVEIGANNGLNLDILAEGFKKVIGVDPCGSGTTFWKSAFNLQAAKDILAKHGQADLIVANNVFAHIDDLSDVFDGISVLLSKDGMLVFEVQCFQSLVDNGLFDMVYHEHRDYHTINPLLRFILKKGLYPNMVERIPNHGGSLRFFCSHDAYTVYPINENIDWERLKARISRVCSKEVKPGTALFGAPAKATTLIHNMGCADKIAFCADDTIGKQGKYIPGTNIKIYPTSKLEGFEGDVLLSAWNYKDVIQARFPNLNLINPHE